MVEGFTLHEGAALCGLLAEGGDDIVLKLDSEGFVVHASGGARRLAIDLTGSLFAPHLADLAEPAQADKLRAFLGAVMRQGRAAGWFEFGARMADGAVNWFTLQLRPLLARAGEVCGAVGIMRSVEERRVLEDRLFAATVTDPLTGLANRRAFQAMLRHLARRRPGGSVLVLHVDDLRTVGLRHGASASDRLVAAIAGLLRDLLHRDHILARLADDRFAVLMPVDDTAKAEAIAEDLLEAIENATRAREPEAPDLRPSIGIARIAGAPDAVLQHAELALIHARARGYARIEVGGAPPAAWRRSA